MFLFTRSYFAHSYTVFEDTLTGDIWGWAGAQGAFTGEVGGGGARYIRGGYWGGRWVHLGYWEPAGAKTKTDGGQGCIIGAIMKVVLTLPIRNQRQHNHAP